jgi:ACR3 family arsenite efflux pump ArsB
MFTPLQAVLIFLGIPICGYIIVYLILDNWETIVRWAENIFMFLIQALSIIGFIILLGILSGIFPNGCSNSHDIQNYDYDRGIHRGH